MISSSSSTPLAAWLLLLASAANTGVRADDSLSLTNRTSSSITLTGFLADMLCTRLEIAPDGANMLLDPHSHTVRCELLPACLRSGYGLIQDIGTDGDSLYRISAVFDEPANDFVVDWLNSADSALADLRIKITGTVLGVAPAAETPAIMSRNSDGFWPAMNDIPLISIDALQFCNYEGPDARPLDLAEECSTANILELLETSDGREALALANMCFREEITLLSSDDATVIVNPDGCADHATFQDVKRADETTCRQTADPDCDATCEATDTCALECLDACGNPLFLPSGRRASTCCLDACGNALYDPCGFPFLDPCGNPTLEDGVTLCPATQIGENQNNDCLDVCGNPVVDACGNPVDQCCLDTCGNPILDPCGFPFLDPCGNPALNADGDVCPSLGANVCLPTEPADCDGDRQCTVDCVDACGNPLFLPSGRQASTCCVDACGNPLYDPCGFPYLDPCGNPTLEDGVTVCPAAQIRASEINECVDACGNPFADACGNPYESCCIDACGNPVLDPCGNPVFDPCGNPLTGVGGELCPARQLGMNACQGSHTDGEQCMVDCVDACGNPLFLASGRQATTCCVDACGNPLYDPCGFPYLDPCGNPTLADGITACPVEQVRTSEVNECVDACGNPFADACGNPYESCCIDACGNPVLDPCGNPVFDPCGNPLTGVGGDICPAGQLGSNDCTSDQGGWTPPGGAGWRSRALVSSSNKKSSSSKNATYKALKRREPKSKGIRQTFLKNHDKIVKSKILSNKKQSTAVRKLQGGQCQRECVDPCGNPLTIDISGRVATTCCLDACGNPLVDPCGFPFYDPCGNPTTGDSGELCAAEHIGEYDHNLCVDVCGNPLTDICGNPFDTCCLDGCGNPLLDPCGFPFTDPCGNPASDAAGTTCTPQQTGANACLQAFAGETCETGCIDGCGNPLILASGRTVSSCCLDPCGNPLLDPCGFPFYDPCGNPTLDDGTTACPAAQIAENDVNDCIDICGNPLTDVCGNPLEQCCLDGCGSPILDPCGFPFVDACGNPALNANGDICPTLGANACLNVGGDDGDGTCSPVSVFPPATNSFQCEGLVSPCTIAMEGDDTVTDGVPQNVFGSRRRLTNRQRRMQGEPSVPLYTPIQKDLRVKIPTSPTSLRVRKELDPAHGGVVGVALNGVLIVHEHPGEGPNTLLFDSCGGHGDLSNRYHYHLPPVCLLRSMGGTVPLSSDWWLAPNAESQWPASARSANGAVKSPLVGWAIDGSPIFGPYNPDNGELVVPAGASGGDEDCGDNVLDECNGMVLENGVYAYFVTPTAPFVPPCLMGEVATEAFVDAGTLNGEVNMCPFAGTDPLAGTEICDEKAIIFQDETCPGNVDRLAIRHCFDLATSSFVGEPTCEQFEAAIVESQSCFLNVGCCQDLEQTIAEWMNMYPALAECSMLTSPACIPFGNDNVLTLTLELEIAVEDLVPDTRALLLRSLANTLEVQPSQVALDRVDEGNSTSTLVFSVAYPSRAEAAAAQAALDIEAITASLGGATGFTVSAFETEHSLPPTIPELWSTQNRIGLGLSLAATVVLLFLIVYFEDVYCVNLRHKHEADHGKAKKILEENVQEPKKEMAPELSNVDL